MFSPANMSRLLYFLNVFFKYLVSRCNRREISARFSVNGEWTRNTDKKLYATLTLTMLHIVHRTLVFFSISYMTKYLNITGSWCLGT